MSESCENSRKMLRDFANVGRIVAVPFIPALMPFTFVLLQKAHLVVDDSSTVLFLRSRARTERERNISLLANIYIYILGFFRLQLISPFPVIAKLVSRAELLPDSPFYLVITHPLDFYAWPNNDGRRRLRGTQGNLGRQPARRQWHRPLPTQRIHRPEFLRRRELPCRSRTPRWR